MAAVHFLGEELETYMEGYRERVISFSTGVSITYVFVQLLPEFHRIATDSAELIFAFPLVGFSSLHLLEKYLAKSGLPKKQLSKDYSEIHSGFLFLYHGAIGYLVASLIADNAVSGLLFFLPIVLHVAVSSFSISELHESITRNPGVKIAISSAPVIGALAYSYGSFSTLFDPVFGTVIGMFFYVVIRDSIPEGDKGRPREYVLGTLLYLAVIIVASSF